ncbi:hypothetical protein FPOAC1_009397 [Fusarium poae]|uniref:Uncharacterized protein n=1 Tax=Fusarium poae TaxID=36050 RepID=A0A1B8ANQ4_FUSPO|nr:hypothetical protein FPOAC1_009397 [Fusarium poae]KAG8669994.1 hypothetical protein FPOAC1_009397 [Fusarium poae]OBS22199.1 hypothetical protein FPOA_08535 [Fusarium poae]
MHPDSELHGRSPECIACSQRRIRISNGPPSPGETPSTVRDDPYGSDYELVTGDHPTEIAVQDGIPRDFRAFCSIWISKGDSVGYPSRIDAEQGSGESGVENCDVEQKGQGQSQIIGDPDEDVEPMDVDYNDEEVYQPQGLVPLWMSEVTNTCMGARHSDIGQVLRQFDLAFRSEAPLETPAADNDIELSDDTGKNE